MAVDDVIEMKYMGHIGPQQTVNVRHWRVQSELGTGATLLEIQAGLDDAVHTALKAVASDDWTYDGCKTRKVRPVPATAEVIRATNAGPGTRAGVAMPYQVSGLISLRSSFAPGNVRGRFYAPPADRLDADTGMAWDAAYVTVLVALATALTNQYLIGTAPNQSTLVPVIFRRTPLLAHIIDSFVVRGNPATQRRRATVNPGDDTTL